MNTIFSPCRQYRYTLWREWNDLLTAQIGYVQFIGLNPSTADEVIDDPTIRRCIGFCESWGYKRFCMTNLFAFRARDPKVMKAQLDPIGTENDRWLKEIARGADKVIAAWGAHGNYLDRARQVREMIPNLLCLGRTEHGEPKHPLYLRADTKLERYL